ncbi:response regulator [Nonomuraea sp. NPDC003201]
MIGTAGSGEQALERIAELRPDLVLLDLYLPDVFGLDVITRMRAAGHDCDVIVISAARELDAVRGAARRGVSNYLLKPFDVDDLRVRRLPGQRPPLFRAPGRDRPGGGLPALRRHRPPGTPLPVAPPRVIPRTGGHAGRPHRH